MQWIGNSQLKTTGPVMLLSVFVSWLLSVSGILGQTSRMCVLKGSTVDMPCRVYSPGGQSTHRIDEVRESDAKTYQCTADSTDASIVSLSVTDLQVTVILGPLREGQGVILNCNTSCPLTDRHTYMWYKNGQFLYEDSSPWYQLPVNSEEEVIYSCAVKGHEALKAPDVSVNSVDPSCFRMTYADGRMCPKSLMNNCSITFFRDLHVKVTVINAAQVQLSCRTTCTLTNLKPTFLWYRIRDYVATDQKHTVYRSSDDGYYCVVKDQKDLLSPSVCVQGESCWRVNYMKQRICALIGSSVNISCNYSYPPGYVLVDTSDTNTYWYTTRLLSLTKDPNYEHRVKFSGQTKNHHTLTINNLTERDSSEYIFRFHTNKPGRKVSGLPGVKLHVTGLTLKMIPAANTTEGQRVTLVCSSSCPLTDNPTYMWYHNSVTQKQSQQNYVVLDPVSSQDAGEYSCAVKGHEELRSPEETLTVTLQFSQSSAVRNAAIGITVVISLVFLAFLWILGKKTQDSRTDPAQSGQTHSDPMYENISAVSRTLVTAPHGEPTG